MADAADAADEAVAVVAVVAAATMKVAHSEYYITNSFENGVTVEEGELNETTPIWSWTRWIWTG